MSEFNSLEDLVFSRSFRNWVLNRESSEHAFWENWIKRNPERAEIVKNAKAVIYALHLNTAELSADEIDDEVGKALIRLKEAPRYIPLEGLDGRRGRWRGVLRSPRSWVLVVLTAAIGTGGFFYYRAQAHVRQIFLNRHRPVQVLTADTGREFPLPDGSVARLEKGSKLYFPDQWGSDRTRREVFLEGIASFDIRGNPAAPFYVYTDQIIIKVLGTRFVVSTFPADGRTVVVDLSGKVALYREQDLEAPPGPRNEPEGVVLTPNQWVLYDRREDRIYKKLVAAPEPLGGLDTIIRYERTPVREVFGRLQEEYGIPIQFDERVLDSCLLTVVVEAEPYYKKLDQICKAIGGAYEVIDGNIEVTAVGCK
ncbi:MAG TPA: FecR family protein [Puia sp.]|nr:FecR family protein [Puia sp.]